MSEYKICRHPFAEKCRSCLKAKSKGEEKNYCTLLNDTKFYSGLCPFYKTREENEKQKKQCEERAKALGYYVHGDYLPCNGGNK